MTTPQDRVLATQAPVGAPGFDTGLDVSRLEDITGEEASALIEWYEKAHGDGQGDLTPFVPFLIEHRPGALKLYRAYAQALDEGGGLPQVVVALLFLHLYMARGIERGVLYEVVAARQWGATKREVLETIELTFVESGPMGGNAAAIAGAYLREWDDAEPRRTPNPWPEAWRTTSPESATITSTSAAARLLGAHAPAALDALRARVQHARTGTQLPVVMTILYDLHGAVAAGRAGDAARATREALDAGVTPAQVIETVGFGALYATVAQLDEVAAAVEQALTSAQPAGT
jgi:alkylhydroperoxidase/carboxymuconolactone decarboxylase family protein YurZ